LTTDEAMCVCVCVCVCVYNTDVCIYVCMYVCMYPPAAGNDTQL